MKQCFAKLLPSDDFLMVPKLGEFVVTRRTPYKHGIHTNQYYTHFSEKVNNFLQKIPLFLTLFQRVCMCKKAIVHSVPDQAKCIHSGVPSLSFFH